jgi:UDP-2,3-diacylglucosamine hydrolase
VNSRPDAVRKAVFVSDVHIAPGETARMRAFGRFAREVIERGCDLFILGDLFDYWLGPRHARASDYAPLLAALRGLPIQYVWGNRDYLLDAPFARRLGWTILGSEARVRAGGRTVLLAHGDRILNENGKYAAYRRAVDVPPVREAIRNLPLFVGRALARGYRRISAPTTPQVVWTEARLRRHVAPLFRRGAHVVVCGHIHMPGRWTWPDGELVLLGDWRAGGEYAVLEDGTLRIESAR